MLFKCNLFLLIIFLLSACGESTPSTVTALPNSDESGVSDDADFAAITERVSVAGDGTQSNAHSWAPVISGDGRYVAFTSRATNLATKETDSRGGIFVYDRQTGSSECVTVSGLTSAISDDGRYLVFASSAADLVADDSNDTLDIFVYDRVTGSSERVSVASDGGESNNSSSSPAISADGRYVAFASRADNLVADDNNGESDIFVHDRDTGSTELVSVDRKGGQGDNGSWSPAISGNGRYVAFYSQATNLVADDTNGEKDVFVHDRDTGSSERVSIASDGSQADFSSFAPSLSDDGRYVTFESQASNLVDADTNGGPDIFVHDRATGSTELVSVASDGSQGNYYSFSPAISGDGRYIVFSSDATNLVLADTNNLRDIFIHDRDSGITKRSSVSSDGSQSNNNRDGIEPAVSAGAAISDNGRYVVFYSYAMNLVADDTNDSSDIFVRSTGSDK